MTASDPGRLLLDTHIWLRYLGISGDLRPAVLPALHAVAAHGTIYLSVISVWEVAMLAKTGRISLSANVGVWVRQALAKPGLQVLGLEPDIAVESVNLPEPVHKDPADRILIASARVMQLTLVTRDEQILHFAERNYLPVLIA